MKRYIYIAIAMLLCMLSPLHASSGVIPDSLARLTSGPSRVSSDGFIQGLSSSNNYVEKITFTNASSNPQYVRDVVYYDGLGYAVQENVIGANPSGKSIITPIVYDNMRRADAVAYLPYAASSGTSSFVQTNSAVSAQATFYRNTFGDSHAYAVNDYEPWAGGIIISSRKPGDAWANGSHDTSHTRRTNTSSDAVRKITQSPGSNSTVTTSGYHSAGSLIVDIVSDEEGDESIVFTDASGKKICTRQNDGSVNADTYFVYDVRDSLVCVIQPEGAASLSSNSTVSFTSDIAQKWFFTWKYDAWGNVTEYHVPGGGTTTYSYDSRNRLISEKTPKLYDLGATRVMTYDDCDRPTTEKYRRDSNGRVIQTHSWTYYPFGTSAPAGSRGLLQSETVWEIPQSMSDSQNSLAYCTRNYSYDSEGRVTGIAESWSDGWSSNVSTTYDFLGNVTSVTETHNGPMGYSQTISTSYTYDQRGRKLTCSRSVSGDETGDMTLATVTYTYDELGRPSGKTVTGANGSTFVDEDIDLDIHGWTTSISAKYNGNVPFFFENLSYTNPSRSISTARFDGNISEITSVHNTANANSSSLAIYSYSYDGMKRLTDARHTGQNITLTESNINTERNITYDRDGNITSLTRYDESGTPLSLSFSNTGNRLTSVNGNTYSYDSAGNMTHDSRKGLDISYNCLNLPRTAVTAYGSSLTYTYLSDGTKVSAMSNQGYGLKYRGSFVYDYDEYDGEQIQSICWDEGRLEMLYPPIDTTTVDFVRFAAPIEEPVDTTGTDFIVRELKDLFFVTDHLGNVRSVVDISPLLSEPEFLEQNDYLPFGTKVQNPLYAKVDDNRYRYAGKEEQRIREVNLSLHDFGARYYDHYAARWTSVDPMADKFSNFSPFDYCGGNPILNLDKDGRIWDTAWDIANVVMDVQSLVSNIKNGNTKDAVIDGVGLAGDLAAAALPFIPGGVGAGIKAARAGDKVVGAINSVDNVVDMSRAADTAVDAKKASSVVKGPTANNGIGGVHGGPLHNSTIDSDVRTMDKQVSEVRKNQVQVDYYGNKVGNNRPDLQYNLNGKHINQEYDYTQKNNDKHRETILRNDPNSVFVGRILKK